MISPASTSGAARGTTPGAWRSAARVIGIDISATFVRLAREAEEAHPLGIRYEVASAVDLPFGDASVDFVTAFMSLMDIPETERAFAEIFRVLRPDGFLQFSISHPCFETPHRKTLRDQSGRAYAREVEGYFRRLEGEVEEWLFSAAPPEVHADTRPFRVPRFTWTLSEWLNLLIDTGFVLSNVSESRTRAMMPSRSGPGYRPRRSSPFSCTFWRASLPEPLT
jgi:SAM-dependent methyltransferase